MIQREDDVVVCIAPLKQALEPLGVGTATVHYMRSDRPVERSAELVDGDGFAKIVLAGLL